MMMPLIAYETLTALELTARVCRRFLKNCVEGITANADRCLKAIEGSLAMVTPVAARIGYDRASELAHRAYTQGRTIREVLCESEILSKEEVDRLLDPRTMI